MSDRLLGIKDIEKLDSFEKIKYYSQLRDYCKSTSSEALSTNMFSKIISSIYPILRNYDYSLQGLENIPKDFNALFVCNHSNSHDFFTALETFNELGSRVSIFSASDDLSFLVKNIFGFCDAVFVDREDKTSSEQSVINMSRNLVSGIPGVIFSETTWNIHPYKVMHQIKAGAVEIAAIAGVPIIPTIFEYVEVPEKCYKESELYKKCIVRFGEPIYIAQDKSLIQQTNLLQSRLEQERLKVWNQINLYKASLRDVNHELYLNHTYLKKFCAFAFQYDSETESKYLLSIDKNPVENEYHMDSNGNFVPGITTKEEGKKYILK